MFIADKFFEIRPNENLLDVINDSSALKFESSFFECECDAKKWIESGARISSIDLGCHIGIERFNNSIFYCNLMLVDSALADIYFWIVYIAHCFKDVSLDFIANVLERIDPLRLYCSLLGGFQFYLVKLKSLLLHVIYGMNSYDVWQGELDLNRIIRVFCSKQVMVFNAYQRGELIEFLMSNLNIYSSCKSSDSGEIILAPSFYLKNNSC